MVDILAADARVPEGLEAGAARFLEQVFQELLEPSAAERLVEVTGT